jgi:hypothetical protein
LASSLEHGDYPNLIATDQRVPTISVPTILACFNWSPSSPRYQRVERFVREFFDHVDRLRAPGFDPRWKTFDISARAPGLERSRPAQDWLDRTASRVSR